MKTLDRLRPILQKTIRVVFSEQTFGITTPLEKMAMVEGALENTCEMIDKDIEAILAKSDIADDEVKITDVQATVVCWEFRDTNRNWFAQKKVLPSYQAALDFARNQLDWKFGNIRAIEIREKENDEPGQYRVKYSRAALEDHGAALHEIAWLRNRLWQYENVIRPLMRYSNPPIDLIRKLIDISNLPDFKP